VTTELLERAQAGDENAFRAIVEPFRQELHLHCYRILGSFHDAEDALQETMLTAWRGLASFEGRSSIRTWLYRIATSRSLNVVRARPGRRTPVRGTMGGAEFPPPTRTAEILWLEPYPDTLLDTVPDSAPGPEARYEMHEATSLAFITALQLLPPRQRAVHILRDVLGFHARDVADMLGCSEQSVTSALKRARATLNREAVASGEANRAPASEAAVAEQFTRAFESDDIESLIELLTEQARISMPPLPLEWIGRAAARQVLQVVLAPGRQLVQTRANRQPAFGLYLPFQDAPGLRAVGLLVLALAGDRVSTITRFEASVLAAFDLPAVLPERPV